MKLTVLVDNNTLNDRHLKGESGVSYLVEAEEKKFCLIQAILEFFLKMLKI